MEDVLHLCCPSRPRLLVSTTRTKFLLPTSRNAPSTILRRHLHLHLPRATTTNVSLPSKSSRSLPPLLVPETTDPLTSSFREKMLFLDSIGVDLFSLAAAHPPIVSSTIEDIRLTIDLLRSVGLSPLDIRRISGMCPEILATKSTNVTQVFTFLLREAGVQGCDLRRVINRRPRLLVSDVVTRLRPTLYFLQMLGIADVARHTSLLSCSVEDKLLPRIEFLLGAGFAPRDARAMARRFPQIFCYSIEENLEPKFDFFTIEMGRDLKELKKFPQYFSFSLPDRIRPRHLMCKEKGVFLTLPALLKPCDEQFRTRLEVCVSSSPPLRISPLWRGS